MLFATDPKDRIENNPEAFKKLADLFDNNMVAHMDMVTKIHDAFAGPALNAMKIFQNLSTFEIPTIQFPKRFSPIEMAEDVYEDEEEDIVSTLKETAEDYVPILGTLPKSWENSMTTL